MANLYNFKKIQPVPSANDFLDIILSKTQRKTPTVVHKGYAISRIRNFYMRKVKFAQESFDERLTQMLEDFPRLDDVHPFYADLMNILYDKDHYKLALGQLNIAKHLIGNVSKDYVKLLKFGDSLYRCKQLKRAALGRMATVMKRQKDSLAYLEQVRQHLSRLPSIDPNTRTLLVCGYPNVGKSSFMNKVTRANVDVQPYAFTTKSLFVGHMDYKYLRWQVIDTPGILDHPLEQRNTIEMQSITALAHLRACVLFFIDISENCGYTISQQVKLFESIKPLFENKPVLLVANKIDLIRPEALAESDKALLQTLLDQGLQMVPSSSMTDEGVMEVRNVACEKLLAIRVESKMKGQKINDILNRLSLATPVARDDKPRPAFIPEAVKNRIKYNPSDPNRRKLAKEEEAENGGAGFFSADHKKHYILDNSEWKYDVIPEILNGKNIADFIDPEIEEKLNELEAEEARLEAEGKYESEEEIKEGEEELTLKQTLKKINEKRKLAVLAGRINKGKNRPLVPVKLRSKNSTFSVHDDENDAEEKEMGESRKRARSSARSQSRVSPKRLHSAVRDRSVFGLSDMKQKEVSDKMHHRSQTIPNLHAKRGESDRVIQTKMPKHLFAGKRKAGTHDRR